MMNRRTFLNYTAVIGGVSVTNPLSALTTAIGGRASQRLTILHTNDTHSNIDPFPLNHAKFPGRGGVAKRFDLINEIRATEEQVLLLDAGDIFQGTPYFNKFGGVLEMKLMQEMGYDAATMGNHDFDGGLHGFAKARAFADFPFICSNYDFSNTILDGLTQDVLILKKGRIKVGIFGLGVELQGLVPATKFGETRYLDPIEIAQDRSKMLKDAGCDLIICLSHLGYHYEHDQVSDLQLAAQTEHIHLIIGGHTHTFLDKPTEVTNRSGKSTLINQVGWGGVNLGRIDFEFEREALYGKEKIAVK